MTASGPAAYFFFFAGAFLAGAFAAAFFAAGFAVFAFISTFLLSISVCPPG